MLVLATSVMQAQGAIAASCTGRWHDVTPLMRGDRPVYIERGVVTGFRGRSLVLGTPTLFWLATDHFAPMDRLTAADSTAIRYAFSRSGAVVDARGIADGTPPADTMRSLRRPQVVAEGARQLTVAWEMHPKMSDGQFRVRSTAVAVSRWDSARWSPIELLHDAQETQLMRPVAYRPGSRGGALLTAAILRAPGARPVVEIVRRAPNGSRQTRFLGATDVFDVIAADVVDGSTSVLFTGMLDRQTGSEWGLFRSRIVWGADGASRWEPPTLLQRASHFDEPAAARLGADSMVVAWAGGQHVVSMWVTGDGGRSWVPLPGPSGATGAEAFVVDSAGRLHLLYRDSSRPDVLNAPGAVMHAVRHHGQWSAPANISGGESMTAPDAGPTPEGGIMAVWSVFTPSAVGPMPRSVARRWTPECRPR